VFENRIDLSGLHAALEDIRKEMAKAVIGQSELIDLMLAALLADGHVLLEGVPGIAKTLTAKTMARVVNTQFTRIQFTPDLMPTDILGTNMYNQGLGKFEFKPGPIFSNLVLIDEINRAPAKTQSALFEVMEERQVTIDGKTYPMQDPFLVLATQNPIEQEGTYRLPEAQLDRFIMKLEVDYPTQTEELNLLEKFHEQGNVIRVEDCKPILDIETLKACRNIVKQVAADQSVLHYIVQLVTHTRQHKSLYLGASPRATLALLTVCKALAVMNGRDFITPDDVKQAWVPVVAHRVLLTPEKEMEGFTMAKVLSQILQQVEVPR
jgi:MoxR-like ATPase